MAKSTRKIELHLYAPGLFSKSLLRKGRHANVNFVFSNNNKVQLVDSNNYLNQKVITTINTLNGSVLGDNLITSYQNDLDQNDLVAIPKVGSTRH